MASPKSIEEINEIQKEAQEIYDYLMHLVYCDNSKKIEELFEFYKALVNPNATMKELADKFKIKMTIARGKNTSHLYETRKLTNEKQ